MVICAVVGCLKQSDRDKNVSAYCGSYAYLWFLWLSVVVYGYQWLVINAHVYCGSYAYLWFLWLSVVVYGYQWLSVVVYGYQWLCMVISGYVWLSVVVDGYQCRANYNIRSPVK